jgi:phosphoglycerol transferase MdoB-like AlkP superfamily enzyme
VRRAGLVVAAWGAVLILHSIVLFIWVGVAYSSVLLLASGLASVVLGLLVAWRASPRRRFVLADVSLPTVLLAVGVFATAGSLVAGRWLAVLGLGILVVATAGLIRESLAMRREARG